MGGGQHLVAWDYSINRVAGMCDAERAQIHNQDQSGEQAWGKTGVSDWVNAGFKCDPLFWRDF
jgi:hypothetical protein